MKGDLRTKRKVLDSDGYPVTPGCTIIFSYGIPPVPVRAKVVERDGRLIALTPGHKPSECPVASLRYHVGNFFICLTTVPNGDTENGA